MTGQQEAEYTVVAASVKRHIAEEFATSATGLDGHTVILEIEDADSVKQLRLTNRLEQEWGVLLMDEDSPIAVTVADLAGQIMTALNRRAVAER
jgi:hypothetical protein